METSSITVEKMQVVNGKAVPTGEYETLEADSLILALGQEADTDFLKHIEGITFKEDGTTVEIKSCNDDRLSGIFAGDMVPSERTVTIATGHGKKQQEILMLGSEIPLTKNHPTILWLPLKNYKFGSKPDAEKKLNNI